MGYHLGKLGPKGPNHSKELSGRYLEPCGSSSRRYRTAFQEPITRFEYQEAGDSRSRRHCAQFQEARDREPVQPTGPAEPRGDTSSMSYYYLKSENQEPINSRSKRHHAQIQGARESVRRRGREREFIHPEEPVQPAEPADIDTIAWITYYESKSKNYIEPKRRAVDNMGKDEEEEPEHEAWMTYNLCISGNYTEPRRRLVENMDEEEEPEYEETWDEEKPEYTETEEEEEEEEYVEKDEEEEDEDDEVRVFLDNNHAFRTLNLSRSGKKHKEFKELSKFKSRRDCYEIQPRRYRTAFQEPMPRRHHSVYQEPSDSRSRRHCAQIHGPNHSKRVQDYDWREIEKAKPAKFRAEARETMPRRDLERAFIHPEEPVQLAGPVEPPGDNDVAAWMRYCYCKNENYTKETGEGGEEEEEEASDQPVDGNKDTLVIATKKDDHPGGYRGCRSTAKQSEAFPDYERPKSKKMKTVACGDDSAKLPKYHMKTAPDQPYGGDYGKKGGVPCLLQVRNSDGEIITASAGLVLPDRPENLQIVPNAECVVICNPVFLPNASVQYYSREYPTVGRAVGVPINWPEEFINYKGEEQDPALE